MIKSIIIVIVVIIIINLGLISLFRPKKLGVAKGCLTKVAWVWHGANPSFLGLATPPDLRL
jgi:hypothetical protein